MRIVDKPVLFCQLHGALLPALFSIKIKSLDIYLAN
jgi:hypothetical protein